MIFSNDELLIALNRMKLEIFDHSSFVIVCWMKFWNPKFKNYYYINLKFNINYVAHEPIEQKFTLFKYIFQNNLQCPITSSRHFWFPERLLGSNLT